MRLVLKIYSQTVGRVIKARAKSKMILLRLVLDAAMNTLLHGQGIKS